MKNIQYDVTDYEEALPKLDIITFLVTHKEFKGLDMQTDLDFCGVLNG
jgi:UDP-N-acetyl-D-mannosaminuronic acid dehydrogenase